VNDDSRKNPETLTWNVKTQNVYLKRNEQKSICVCSLSLKKMTIMELPVVPVLVQESF
jgi:hypothetical protein